MTNKPEQQKEIILGPTGENIKLLSNDELQIKRDMFNQRLMFYQKMGTTTPMMMDQLNFLIDIVNQEMIDRNYIYTKTQSDDLYGYDDPNVVLDISDKPKRFKGIGKDGDKKAADNAIQVKRRTKSPFETDT